MRTPDDARATFTHAHQEMTERWPVPVSAQDVPTGYGRTHVLTSGDPAAPGGAARGAGS